MIPEQLDEVKALSQDVCVAVDAMGGDFGPSVTVPAAVQAVEEDDGRLSVILVGDVDELNQELKKYPQADTDRIAIEGSKGVVEEGERALTAIAGKPEASIFVAAKLVQDGRAGGFISSGATGATFMAAQLAYGTLSDRVERGVLAGNIFGFSRNTYLLDLGALVDVLPHHFPTLATLGVAVARWNGVEQPRVAILNIGTEARKGNRQVKAMDEELRNSKLNYIGSVEPNGLLDGSADVVICDGFIGNIVLKLTEALGDTVYEWLKERLDPSSVKVLDELHVNTNRGLEFGAAPILGLDGVAMVGHGGFGVSQLAVGIKFTASTVAYNLIGAQKQMLKELDTGQSDK